MMNKSNWDLDTSVLDGVDCGSDDDEEDKDGHDVRLSNLPIMDNPNVTFIDSTTHHYADGTLLVLYDPGVQMTKVDDKSYPFKTVTKALGLLKSRHENFTNLPLKLVPCSWLLDSAADYRLLPIV